MCMFLTSLALAPLSVPKYHRTGRAPPSCLLVLSYRPGRCTFGASWNIYLTVEFCHVWSDSHYLEDTISAFNCDLRDKSLGSLILLILFLSTHISGPSKFKILNSYSWLLRNDDTYFHIHMILLCPSAWTFPLTLPYPALLPLSLGNLVAVCHILSCLL